MIHFILGVIGAGFVLAGLFIGFVLILQSLEKYLRKK